MPPKGFVLLFVTNILDLDWIIANKIQSLVFYNHYFVNLYYRKMSLDEK